MVAEPSRELSELAAEFARLPAAWPSRVPEGREAIERIGDFLRTVTKGSLVAS
jgi:hypothetical protein